MDDASEGGELVQTVGPLLGPMAQMPIGPAESKATERSITLSAPDCEGMLGSDPELPVEALPACTCHARYRSRSAFCSPA